VSYSQGGEEAAILKACEGTIGTFLDIGAFSAKALSNTRALYELGWSGVLIEPSPGPVKALIEEYGNDERVIVIAAAVGLDRHMVKFTATDDALTTSESGNVELWKEKGGFYGSFWVPQITLAEITNQFGGFDFVNIDTEGTSFAILKDLLATQMRPRCICCEHDGKMLEMSMAATAAGYRMVFVTGENAVFSL
jgi:FkbM family methyltransferase